jgi:hypothetical protein
LGRASQWVTTEGKTETDPDTDLRHFLFAGSGSDKGRVKIDLVKFRVEKTDSLENLISWNNVTVKRLIVAVRRKDSRKVENFLASKGYSIVESY